ncbi:succinate dehydrogenase [Candidatus Electronema sp. JM]|uniref:succinate dehydrogenase n=1 Tax=Candidatus Electronema sp. JM TaxID=3401571 RepID=UPI003AA876E4
MSRLPYFFSSSLGRKYIMALTGLLLGGFLVAHAAGNSLIFHSRTAFTAYADHLHSLGLLLPAAGLLLLAVFLLHIVTGFSLALHNWRAKGSLRRSAAGWRGWPARMMPYSGAAVLAFMLLHLATVRFADQTVPVAERISQTLTDPLLAGLYAAGIAALGLHISHGFWSLTQSLGLNHPRWNWLLRAVGCFCGSLSISVFAGIILLHFA